MSFEGFESRERLGIHILWEVFENADSLEFSEKIGKKEKRKRKEREKRRKCDHHKNSSLFLNNLKIYI